MHVIISCTELEFRLEQSFCMCRSSVFLLPLQYEYYMYSYMVAAFIISVPGIICSNAEKSNSYLTLIVVLHCFSAVWNLLSPLVPLNSSIKYLKQ